MKSYAERFLSRTIPEPNSGCLLWTGRTDRDGYGSLGSRHAHRISWELNVGPIPAGMEVCHKCDVRSCVNSGHLFLGTHADNIADMMRKGRLPPRRGQHNGHSKLEEVDVRRILADSRPQSQIASDYGVSKSTIGMIKARINWAHLEI